MINVTMTIIQCALKWISDNYHLEIKEDRSDYDVLVKTHVRVVQTRSELTKW
jgi:hypothetical protein